MSLNYICSNVVQEHHEQPIFCVTFNTYDPDNYDLVASVGGQQATVYRSKSSGELAVLRTYIDDHARGPAAQQELESWFACKWTLDVDTRDPLLLVAGKLGLIRVINIQTNEKLQTLKGHGKEVNDLSVHPQHPHLIISGSKDQSMRVWNIALGCCVLLVRGPGGHLGEVFSLDFHPWNADLFVSGGMDQAVKIWSLKEHWSHIQQSMQGALPSSSKAYPVKLLPHPIFSSTRIHHDYVDCVRFLGDLIVSKSTDFKIHLWRPIYPDNPLLETSSNFQLLRVLEMGGRIQWWFRFSIDLLGKVLVCGNNVGELHVFDPHSQDKHQRGVILKHKTATNETIFRQVAVSHDGSTIIASTEDGCLYRWDRKEIKGQQQQQQRQRAKQRQQQQQNLQTLRSQRLRRRVRWSDTAAAAAEVEVADEGGQQSKSPAEQQQSVQTAVTAAAAPAEVGAAAQTAETEATAADIEAATAEAENLATAAGTGAAVFVHTPQSPPTMPLANAVPAASAAAVTAACITAASSSTAAAAAAAAGVVFGADQGAAAAPCVNPQAPSHHQQQQQPQEEQQGRTLQHQQPEQQDQQQQHERVAAVASTGCAEQQIHVAAAAFTAAAAPPLATAAEVMDTTTAVVVARDDGGAVACDVPGAAPAAAVDCCGGSGSGVHDALVDPAAAAAVAGGAIPEAAAAAADADDSINDDHGVDGAMLEVAVASDAGSSIISVSSGGDSQLTIEISD